MITRVSIIDSHTGGEPTRVVVSGCPDLGGGTVKDRVKVFHDQHGAFRAAVVKEPRGNDVLVGALLLEAAEPECVCGVIFFNNVGVLGMCGHGTIGVMTTLALLGRITPGTHKIETCVGVVTATLHEDGEVSLENVPSFRTRKGVKVGELTGDIAWGGNWFFLCDNAGVEISLKNVDTLTVLAWRARQALNQNGFPELDHVEFFGPPTAEGAHSKNFVLCPGNAYDRSPCGTGTSAKLACLAADGKLAEGDWWVQESVIGSTLAGTYRREGETIIPTIKGRAWVNAEATLILDERDPFCWGIG